MNSYAGWYGTFRRPPHQCLLSRAPDAPSDAKGQARSPHSNAQRPQSRDATAKQRNPRFRAGIEPNLARPSLPAHPYQTPSPGPSTTWRPFPTAPGRGSDSGETCRGCRTVSSDLRRRRSHSHSNRLIWRDHRLAGAGVRCAASGVSYRHFGCPWVAVVRQVSRMVGDTLPCPKMPLGSRTVTRRCSQPSELANAWRSTAQLGCGSMWNAYPGHRADSLGAFLQEHTEDHPMAHLREPAIEVWLEPQLPRDSSLWI